MERANTKARKVTSKKLKNKLQNYSPNKAKNEKNLMGLLIPNHQ